MKRKVVISQAVPDEALALLLDAGFETALPDEPGQEAFERCARDADAIVLRTNAAVTREFLDTAGNLKIVSRTGAGVDNVDCRACAGKNVVVCNLPGVNNVSVAEHAVAMIAALVKFLPLMDRSVRSGDWQARRKNLPRELRGKTAGVVGMGAIGSIAAAILAGGFGTKILAYDPFVDPAKFPDYEFTSDLRPLFAKSDFVTLHLPSLPSTRRVVNAGLLGAMQPHAILVNCSRGDIVDADALYDALAENRIAGAGLDVFEDEPPAPDNRLLALPNALFSPHAAALTKEASLRMSTEACRQIVVFFETGRPLWEYRQPPDRQG